MKKNVRRLIIGIILLALFIFACPPLPKIPDKGEPLDIAALGQNFWVRLYLMVMPSPIPGYPALMARNTVWEKRSRPHRVKDNLYIAHGVTLTIEPGARVEIGPEVRITNMGRIIAKGAKDDPIVITCGDEKQNWDLIECNQEWKNQESNRETNVFENCIVERGRGIIIRSSSARIEACTFRRNVSSSVRMEFSAGDIIGNKFYENSTETEAASGNGAGIMIYSDREVVVADNEIYDNRSVGGRDGGGGIYAFAYDRGKVSLLRNTLRNNYSDQNGGAMVAYECLVEGNRIENNRTAIGGGGIYAIRSQLIGNRIENNQARQGGGVYAENCRMSGNFLDRNSAPASSGGGLYYFGDGRIENNTFVRNGAAEEGGETIMISGGPTLAGNNIIADRGHALRIESHSLSPDVNANGNYWGTVDADAIQALVFDWLDNGDVGMAAWGNLRTEWNAEAPEAPEGIARTVAPLKMENAPDFFAGEVKTDTSIGNSTGEPYRIGGNILVRKGCTLTVLPGTTFAIAPNASIRVRGHLAAEGTDKSPIRFSGDPAAPWGTILIESRSELDQTPSDQGTQDKCVLKHCVVENGRGIQMDGAGGLVEQCIVRNNLDGGIAIRDTPARITNSEIIDNRGAKNGGGIYIYSSLPVELLSNTILRNRTAGDGGGVFAYGYHSNAAVNLENNRIEENHCDGDGGGVWATRSSIVKNQIEANRADGNGGGVFVSFGIVNGNRILKNQGVKGGGVFAETNSTLEGNHIAENRAEDELGGGVYLNFWGVSIKNEAFRHNKVTDNQASGTGGIYLNGTMIFEENAIHGNQGIQLYNGNPAKDEPFTAINCFWGTQKKEEIEQAVYDQGDNPKLGQVIFEPFASNAGKIAIP